MGIIAFDCATTTGWAVKGKDGVRSGIKNFTTARGESPGIRFMRFSRWVGEMLDAEKPALVVYELSHMRGGAATELCVGFTTRVMEAAAARGIEYVGVHSQELKKSATGKGNAGKELMQSRAAELFPHYRPEADAGADEADALHMTTWAEGALIDAQK